MAEYIEREATINRIERYALGAYGIDLDDAKQFTGDEFADTFCEGLNSAVELIGDITAADVAPVVHGRWIDGLECSVCGAERPSDSPHDVIYGEDCRFCYSCGAKMDGGAEHD